MMALPAGNRVWVAAGVTDMRNGMQGLAALMQAALGERPLSVMCSCSVVSAAICLKLLWWSSDGMNVYETYGVGVVPLALLAVARPPMRPRARRVQRMRAPGY